MCHAQDGKGYAAIHTPDFTDSKWQAAHKDDELIDAVTNGKQGEGKMPPFKDKLTPEQIDMLVKCAVRGFATKHVENNEKGGK
jgi:mono/diheme cytochrome c family protein